MGRIGKFLAWVVAVLIGLPVLLVGLVFLLGNIDPGQRLIERLTPSLTGGEVHLAGLSGRFPDRLRASRLEIADQDGIYLTIDDLVFDWSPLRLLHRELDIQRLDAAAVDFAREPQSSGSSSSSLPVRMTLHEFQVGRLTVGAAVAGQSYSVAVNGAGELASLTQGSGRLTVRQQDGSGRYSLDGAIDGQRLHAVIKAAEPAHGLISGLAGLPDLGAIAIDATLDGPRNAVATDLAVSAGPLQAQAKGTLDLQQGAADLRVAATAPAMSPRPDLTWRGVSLNAKVSGPFIRPEASGQLRIEALQASGAGVSRLTANLSGNAGAVRLQATLDGLTLPGQQPELLAAGPVQIDATARLDAPDRPVNFTVRHPLLDAQGTARTAGDMSAHMVLNLPDLAPVAAAGGTDVKGHTALTLDVAQQAAITNVSLHGTIGVTGGVAQLQALLGDAAKLDMQASLGNGNATLQHLQVSGRGVEVGAHGSLAGAQVDLHWTMAVSDLAALQPTLNGRLDAQGQLTGKEDDLAASAEIRGNVGAQGVESGPVSLRVQAQGLPNHPSGTLTAEGALLDAPVNVAVDASRENGAMHLTIRSGAWQSLQADGALTLPPGATIPAGSLHLHMARLADLAPLLGRSLAGSIDAALDATADQAKLTLNAQGAALPGTAAVARVALTAVATDLQGSPTLRANLALDDIRAGGIGASVRMEAKGPQNALQVTLSGAAPDIAGAAAKLNAAVTVDATQRTVAVSSLEAAWKQQDIKLLAPVRFSLADGGAIDHLRLGLRQAVLELNGRVSPALDLTASLRNLPADIAAVADPTLAMEGTISADARLTGSTARPQGTVRLTATGLRQRSGPGRALPAANIAANATLIDTTARLDTKLTAGGSRLNVTGTAPLSASGALDLRANGAIDLALLDPILTVEGRRVRGSLGLDATIAGTVDAPRASGTVRLTRGEVQDFPMGVHVTDIAATLQADGDRLRLTQFTGRAGSGTIGGSGSISLVAPMPVDLVFTAADARPVASDLLTANIDSHMTVQGDVQGRLNVAGTLHVRHAEIRVPEKLPHSVAVLPVRNANAAAPRRRAKPPPAAPIAAMSIIALNVTLEAPQEVFIRGRGLDVELGGTVHIRGTAAQPQPDGGLKLRRGSLSLAGQTLTFTDGSIDFTGARVADPQIRLVATSTNNSITATLTITGSAQDPKIVLSSVPDLPQDEVLAQLLFHQAIGKLSAFQVAAIAAALADLTGAGGGIGDPLASLRNSLGLDRLSVGTGRTGSPTLEAGRYLAPGVYLGAKQSATGTGTQASVQIDIAKGLKLETTAGTGSSSATGAASSGEAASVGLTYQFEY